MNERNVTALLGLLHLAKRARWDVGSQKFLPTEQEQNHDLSDLARFLTYSGVLVPSALTDNDYNPILAATCSAHSMDSFAKYLERIAKGTSGEGPAA